MRPPIKILYFAWVRELIGIDEEDVHPPETVRDIAALLAYLITCSPRHKEALSDAARLRFAHNQNFVSLEAPVQAGDEVAIFPPVTGG